VFREWPKLHAQVASVAILGWDLSSRDLDFAAAHVLPASRRFCQMEKKAGEVKPRFSKLVFLFFLISKTAKN
jgi:hypothetical protein